MAISPISATAVQSSYAANSYSNAASVNSDATQQSSSFSQYANAPAQSAAPDNDNDNTDTSSAPVAAAQTVPTPAVYNSVSSASAPTIRGVSLDVTA